MGRAEVGGDVVVGMGALGGIMQMVSFLESRPLFSEIGRREKRSSRGGVRGVFYKVKIPTKEGVQAWISSIHCT